MNELYKKAVSYYDKATKQWKEDEDESEDSYEFNFDLNTFINYVLSKIDYKRLFDKIDSGLGERLYNFDIEYQIVNSYRKGLDKSGEDALYKKLMNIREKAIQKYHDELATKLIEDNSELIKHIANEYYLQKIQRNLSNSISGIIGKLYKLPEKLEKEIDKNYANIEKSYVDFNSKTTYILIDYMKKVYEEEYGNQGLSYETINNLSPEEMLNAFQVGTENLKNIETNFEKDNVKMKILKNIFENIDKVKNIFAEDTSFVYGNKQFLADLMNDSNILNISKIMNDIERVTKD